MNKALTPNMEMYLKTILEIDGDGSEARVKGIADKLGVKMPSVTGAVDSLQKRGLVRHSPYGGVELTPRGRRLAREVKDRNDLLVRFLRDVLNLPEKIAVRDACELEHVVSPKTIERLSAFLKFTEVCKSGASELMQHFAEWVESQESDTTCETCVSEGEGTRCTH